MKKMMFEEAEMELIAFEDSDVIATSGLSNSGQGGLDDGEVDASGDKQAS